MFEAVRWMQMMRNPGFGVGGEREKASGLNDGVHVSLSREERLRERERER